MKEKKVYQYMLSLFFIIIFSVPIYWITRGSVTSSISIIEQRSLINFPTLSLSKMKTSAKRVLQLRFAEAGDLFLNQFFDLSYQNGVEEAASDQFPLRLSFIQTEKTLERGIIGMSYALLPDPAIPTDMQSNLYVTRDGSNILYGPDTFNNSDIKAINNRITNYNTLISDYPNLHFYLFYHQRISNSAYHPLNQYFPEADKGQALAYFVAHKPAGLTMSTMLLNSFAEHVEEYYATDHHWNVRGVGVAYNKSYDLLAKNYPDISPRLNLNSIITFPDINFLGSLARESYYPVTGDKFQVFKLDMPAYKVFLNGKEYAYNNQTAYLAGNYSTAPYVDHYGKYYGGQEDVLDFDFEDGATRNLLIIGTSFARPVVPMLASHYHHTYYVDMRQSPGFALSSFLVDHPVDDVLFLGDNTVAFTSSIWLIKP